jgi:hypothetical protein
MECPNCELKQRQFFCARCIGALYVPAFPVCLPDLLTTSRYRVQDFCTKTEKTIADRDEHIARASLALKGADEQRTRRADLAEAQARAKDVADVLDSVRKSNEDRMSLFRHASSVSLI